MYLIFTELKSELMYLEIGVGGLSMKEPER